MPIGKIYQPKKELLNYNTDWNLLPDVRSAFIDKPKRVKLESGFLLYKFSDSEIKNSSGRITEWWFPKEPYGIDPGLEVRLNLAKRLGVPAPDLIRVVGAVKENWNALTYLIEARLKKPLFCLWGQCSVQKRKDMLQSPRAGLLTTRDRYDMPLVRTEKLPGYSWQLYIPGLTDEHIEEIRKTRVLP
jgi:hypothetical protein